MQKAFIFIITVFSLFSCAKTDERLFKKSRIAMDTVVSITAAARSDRDAEDAINAGFKEVDRLAGLLDCFAPASEVARINNASGLAPVHVSKETCEVIEKAVYVSGHTSGAFDVTIGAVSSLWDFPNGKMADKAAVADKIKLVGYKNIILDKQAGTVFLKKKGMRIDLGAIAKGYAADRVEALLKAKGIRSGIVAMGGDIKAFGMKPDGSMWKIGIKNPRETSSGDEIFAALPLTDNAISTSGDYERFIIKDGVRYHHILDPKTGFPAYGCRSVSVITKAAAFTDAFSTGIFVLGPGRGIDLLNKLGFEGVIVDDNGVIHTTERIKKSLEFTAKKS